MSDFSLLYKKYNSVSNQTTNLNNAVITLKRRVASEQEEYRHKFPGLAVSDDEVTKAGQTLSKELALLAAFYKKQDTQNEFYDLMDNELFRKQILNNPDFQKSVTGILRKLKSQNRLTEKDLTAIDKLITILDNEASLLFRTLRTSRG